MPLNVIGVHPVQAPEPCHLIEVVLVNADQYEWGKVTQEVLGQPKSNWQVAYDEQPLDSARSRWVFFFHYLDHEKPLFTTEGPVPLPAPTPLPAHLMHIQYLEP